MVGGGYGNNGRRYRTISELWRTASARVDDWYGKSRDYWEHTELSDNGVLGGFGHISDIDLESSRQLICSLPNLQRNHALGNEPNASIVVFMSRFVHVFIVGNDRVAVTSLLTLIFVDCGAGIGRITKGLLLPLFQHVDLVEQSPAHIGMARDALESHPGMNAFFEAGLQAYTPTAGLYDLIWVQWVVGYLTDADLEQFLDRCAAALSVPDAVVVLKENVARREFFLDADDNNVTRTLSQFQALFRRTRLALIKTKVQDGFPKDLHPVYMFVLGRCP